MGELPDSGVPYETIVITQGEHLNAAALSAVRDGGYMHLRSFRGSNTFENLKRMERFSVNYIAPENRGLFIRAALRGWGDNEQEIEEDGMEYEPFPHLKTAKGWAICVPENIGTEEISDEIGKTEVLHVEARILMWVGSADGCIKVGEDRNIMALVAYTRYLISKGEVREKYRKRAMELADEGDEVGMWVLENLG